MIIRLSQPSLSLVGAGTEHENISIKGEKIILVSKNVGSKNFNTKKLLSKNVFDQNVVQKFD